MYAHVRYADKQTSVLPVSLIQRFTPKHIEDFDPKKTKLAFWQDLDGGDGGYYDCRVVMLGETKAQLLKQMVKERLPIPAVILQDAVGHCETPDEPSKAAQIAAGPSGRQKVGERLKRKDSEERENLLPATELKNAKKKIRTLQSEIITLKKELEDERALCRKVQYTLLHKLDGMLLSSPGENAGQDFAIEPLSEQLHFPRPHQASVVRHAEVVPSSPPLIPAHFHAQAPARVPVQTPARTPSHAPLQAPIDAPVQATARAACPATIPPPVRSPTHLPAPCPTPGLAPVPVQINFDEDEADVNNSPPVCPGPDQVGPKVDLGGGVFVLQQKLDDLLQAEKMTDSRFCRDVLRLMYGKGELLYRSVTGSKSRRFMKEDREANKGITPRKMLAVKKAYVLYMREKNKNIQDSEINSRLANVNKFIASMLYDNINRARKALFANNVFANSV